MKRIVVTGGAGQLAYSLVFLLASGALYGVDEPISLSLIDLPSQQGILEAMAMELEDSAFTSLQQLHVGSDSARLFNKADFVFLLGARPRGPGMERKELLTSNAGIFAEQGRIIQESAAADVRILVVGNPCNTNAWVLAHSGPRLIKSNIHAMTRLDQNRARGLLAKKAQVLLSEVSEPIIWGNHSNTQVPDCTHTTIHGRLAYEVLPKSFIEGDFVKSIQERGQEIIKVRGKSSAASAAWSALMAASDLIRPTVDGGLYCSGVYSEANPYGIDPDLFFSFPCRTRKDLGIEIIRGFTWNAWLQDKIHASEKELCLEREAVRICLGGM